jgi:hypothetical protein
MVVAEEWTDGLSMFSYHSISVIYPVMWLRLLDEFVKFRMQQAGGEWDVLLC